MLVWAARKLDCMNFCRGRMSFGFCAKDRECSGGAESKIKIMQLNSVFMKFCSGKANFSFFHAKTMHAVVAQNPKTKYELESFYQNKFLSVSMPLFTSYLRK